MNVQGNEQATEQATEQANDQANALANELAQWQKNNDAYLAAALRWLRLRLGRLAASGQIVTPQPAPPPPEPEAPSWFCRWFMRAPEPSVAVEQKLLPPADGAITDEQIAAAAAAMQQAAQAEPPPALVILSRRLGLAKFEQELLLLCAAMELDTRVAALCAQAQGDQSRRWPTFALGLTLFDEPLWEALSPERPLRYWRLLEINQPGAQPLTTSALRADERIVNYLKGLNYLDDRLAPLFTPLSADESFLPPSQQALVEQVRHGLSRPPPPLIHLLGAEPAAKQLIAAHAAMALRLNLYRLSAELLPTAAGELETLARLWQRECLLLPLALYLDAHETEKDWPTLQRFLARTDGLIFLDTRENWPGLNRDALVLQVAKPSQAEQRAAWSSVLIPPPLAANETTATAAATLAAQFNFSLSDIQRIARMVKLAQQGQTPSAPLWQACLQTARPRLDALAQRIEVKADWTQLVLPVTEADLLKQVSAQVRERATVYQAWGFAQRMNRGLGINALFAGESGTGKTMAAEVIAHELQLNLYRIDLSAVISKYIGETEKNLRRVFDAAETGGAILFFDEADALFGKRSEVKDSHDRYANIEVNYLLQRMESFGGLAILATNMKGALDQAFMRRLRFIVNFPFPSAAERRRIWEKAFPPEAPKSALDYDRLARLNLTGGSIHNIALNAAFLAAREKSRTITMSLILEAARAEFRKLDKPVNEADFRWAAPLRAAA